MTCHWETIDRKKKRIHEGFVHKVATALSPYTSAQHNNTATKRLKSLVCTQTTKRSPKTVASHKKAAISDGRPQATTKSNHLQKTQTSSSTGGDHERHIPERPNRANLQHSDQRGKRSRDRHGKKEHNGGQQPATLPRQRLKPRAKARDTMHISTRVKAQPIAEASNDMAEQTESSHVQQNIVNVSSRNN